MPRSMLALKLTSPAGKTRHGKKGVYEGTLLRVGLLVTRRKKTRQRLCAASAVHAYQNLEQALGNDWGHCKHGRQGILWLVRLYQPSRPRYGSKLTGTSYKVLKKIGPIGAANAQQVAALLKD